MRPRAAIAFVKKRGLVLESARGPVPSLAETIAGGRIRGSWWGHAKGDSIFACTRAVRSSKDVLTCRLLQGKVTYVHRRLWPALVRLSDYFRGEQLARIQEIHTAAGKHHIDTVPFPRWVLPEEERKGAKLSEQQAIALLKRAGLTELRRRK